MSILTGDGLCQEEIQVCSFKDMNHSVEGDAKRKPKGHTKDLKLK